MADAGKWSFRGEGNAFLVLTNAEVSYKSR